ncbi:MULTISPECIES: hypothetical protein [unclassified Bradyrhizobium]|uniref:hypothetical protein n=1 Tax=unclassified Bradyrhizobium TaxID=2631580 RepID=UPI000B86F0D7|nr:MULTISPECIES: hypothetical protein [unclassified Bradyrhizobium]MBB4376861.1 hypothetical protein [Bradyrhizobium sp. SBR1B]
MTTSARSRVESGENLLPIHKWNTERETFLLLLLPHLHVSPHARRAGSFGVDAFCLEDVAELGAGARD